MEQKTNLGNAGYHLSKAYDSIYKQKILSEFNEKDRRELKILKAQIFNLRILVEEIR